MAMHLDQLISSRICRVTAGHPETRVLTHQEASLRQPRVSLRNRMLMVWRWLRTLTLAYAIGAS